MLGLLLVTYANQLTALAEQWVRGFRTASHSQQDTTGACEGFHSALKGCGLADRRRLSNRRLDWLLHVLTEKVTFAMCLKSYIHNWQNIAVHPMYNCLT